VGGTPGLAPRLTFAQLVYPNWTPAPRRCILACAMQVPTHRGRPPVEVEEQTFAQFGRTQVCLLRRRERRANKGNLVVRRVGTRELLEPRVEDDNRAPTADVVTL
jgi:hypothetical protein